MSSNHTCNGYTPIRDYAVIGNCRTAALVSREGSIDWMCPDRFDAPAVLSRLLDARRGGFFELTVQGDHQTSRRYLPRTNVLETTYRQGDAIAEVIDFMPMEEESDDLVS